ncbi:MAG: hypothetical protein AAGE86_09665 [Pseudomonadota bacterium]
MSRSLIHTVLTATMLASGLSLNPCATTSIAQERGEASPVGQGETLVIELEAGQVLQLIAPQARAKGGAARQSYYRAAFPIAESLGYQRLGQLNVKQKVVSDYDPGAFIFFSWPDERAANEFASHPQWPAIKETRPAAWDELKIYNSVLESDLQLTFDPAKHYSVVVAWFDPDNPSDYDRYLTGIESAVDRAGGRFIYKMRNPTFEAHASAPTAPGQITFVEWNSPDGFAEVQKSEEYLAHRQYFGSGLERFEFYWLTPAT